MSAADVAEVIVIAVMLYAVYLFGFGHGHKVGHAQGLMDARQEAEE